MVEVPLTIGMVSRCVATSVLLTWVCTSLAWSVSTGAATPEHWRRQVHTDPKHSALLVNQAAVKPVAAVSKRQVRLELAPWHASWNNSIALCAVTRDEHVEDVTEWLQYYR